MHRQIPPYPHAIIDYVLVAVLFLAPWWFAFNGTPAVLSYLLGLTLLGISLATAYPLGIWRVIPFPAHGRLELIAGGAMVLLPWIGMFGADDKARWFFIIAGLAVMGLYAATDYRTLPEERAAERVPRG